MATKTMNKTINGVDTGALTRMMDTIKADHAQGKARFDVTTRWMGGATSETHIEGWELAGQWRPQDFTIRIDEPEELLGTNTAPNPQEYLMASVNACMMATYVAAFAMQGVEIESLEIRTQGRLDLRGFLGLDKKVPAGYEEMEYEVHVRGKGTPQQYQQVHEWVMATSPNYYNMANAIHMKPRLVVEE